MIYQDKKFNVVINEKILIIKAYINIQNS